MPSSTPQSRIGHIERGSLLQSSRPSTQLLAVLLGTAILAMSSYVTVPMVPVPITLQTLAVTLIGAAYGWQLGTATVLLWLVEGACGLPVFAGGTAGIQAFVGPTAGYLCAFPFAAALVGALAQRGWGGQHPALAFANMLLGNLLCLALGGLWLSHLVRMEVAIKLGVLPFVLGGIVKSLLGAAMLRGLVPWTMDGRETDVR